VLVSGQALKQSFDLLSRVREFVVFSHAVSNTFVLLSGFPWKSSCGGELCQHSMTPTFPRNWPDARELPKMHAKLASSCRARNLDVFASWWA
jgi:hypothetical protein